MDQQAYVNPSSRAGTEVYGLPRSREIGAVLDPVVGKPKGQLFVTPHESKGDLRPYQESPSTLKSSLHDGVYHFDMEAKEDIPEEKCRALLERGTFGRVGLLIWAGASGDFAGAVLPR